MQNSLRIIRKAKGFNSAEALGKAMGGYDFRTVNQYETQEEPISRKFAAKAAEVLGVTVEEIDAAPTETLSEDSPPYRVSSVALDLLPNALIDQMILAYSAQMPGSGKEQRGKIIHSLTVLDQELSRRGLTEAREQEHLDDEPEKPGDIVGDVVEHHRRKPKGPGFH